jgi:hypothetical protein
MNRIERDLNEAGAALRQEQGGLDLDQLLGDIARETVRQEQLLKYIADASTLGHQKQVELSALLKGRDGGGAAEERAEANAELLSITERQLASAASIFRTM